MNLNAAVVIDESQFPEFIHKKADAGARRANHVRKRLLADLCDHRFRLTLLAEIRQQTEKSREPLLTRIEQLIDEIGLNADGPG